MNVVTVFSVKRYNFQNPEGETIKGCKVQIATEPMQSTDEKGLQVSTINAPYTLYNEFTDLPGKYQVNMTFGTGNKARPSIIAIQKVEK